MRQLGDPDVVTLAGDIVSAFVCSNAVHVSDLPRLVETVHASLKGIPEPAPVPVPAAPVPAVSVWTSVTDDDLICLEGGKRFKSLKRHLRQVYGMTPDAYRARWKLPRDCPMVAPGYAARRSLLAKENGLGAIAASWPAGAPGSTAATAADPFPQRAAARRTEPALRRPRPVIGSSLVPTAGPRRFAAILMLVACAAAVAVPARAGTDCPGGLMPDGTRTCLRLSGRVEAGASLSTGGGLRAGRTALRLHSAARVDADARTLTELGPVRVFTSVRLRPSGTGVR